MFSLTALATAIILVVAARAVVDLHPEAYRQIGVVLPSGHSALVVVTVVTLAALAWPRWSRGRVGAAVALILAVGWVMTKSGHTAGDVLVGLALGCVSVLVAGAVARIRRPRKVSPSRCNQVRPTLAKEQRPNCPGRPHFLGRSASNLDAVAAGNCEARLRPVVVAHPISVAGILRTSARPRQMILGLDSSDDPLHGHQEDRFCHGY